MMQPYPAYKNAGVPWLGEIPEHWEVRRLKYLTQFQNGFAFKPTDWKSNGVPIIRIQNLNGAENFNYTDKTDIPNELLIKTGDLLFAWSGNKGTSFGSFIWEKNYPAYLNQHIFKLQNFKLPLRYFYYLLRAVTQYVEEQAQGIIGLVHITKPELGAISVPLPPPAEQKQIAAFLDWKSAQIQRLIDNKQQQMAKLKAYKQSMIHRAVTRGLNPAVKFKPSGVPWLGDIPEHWEVRRLKSLLKCALQYGLNEQSGQQEANAPRFIRITDIKDNGELKEDTFCTVSEHLAQAYLLQDGDILFARSGSVGKTFCYQKKWGKAAFAGYLIRAKIDNKLVNHEFVFLFTRSKAYLDWIEATFIKTTIQNISAEKYAALQIPLPPPAEQKQIVEYLEQRAATLDRAINRAEQEIQLLAEYRTRLIADVVTGKLDVRAVALPPNETAH